MYDIMIVILCSCASVRSFVRLLSFIFPIKRCSSYCPRYNVRLHGSRF